MADSRKHRKPGQAKDGRRRGIVWMAGATLLIVVASAGTAIFFNPQLTGMVNGPGFAQALDKETAKGLHLQEGKYESIRRTGIFTAESVEFKGSGGWKAIKSITASGITAVFNPGGILLRRWQLSSVHLRSGKIEVQTYTPKPEEKPAKPWSALLMPDRVYLGQVTCDKADVTWQMRGREGGFFGTQLSIIPHGRDFDYRATGGEFRCPPLPPMPLQQVHVLITKPLLSLWALDATPSDKGKIHVEGTAGLKGDQSTRVLVVFNHVPLSKWIPLSWGEQIHGMMGGQIVWESSDQTIESSHGNGVLHFYGVRMAGIPFLDYMASATKNAALKELALSECSVVFTWAYPVVKFSEIHLEALKAFRLDGWLRMDGKNLHGSFDLGVSPENLAWLPKAKDQIFTKADGGYLWTTVKLDGTLQDPRDDLTPRLAQALKGSPVETTGLFFRTTGEWLKQTWGGE